MAAKKKAYRILMGNPEGKRPLERHRRKWEDDIKMDFRDRIRCGLDWSSSG
jgi:hypothetical protein